MALAIYHLHVKNISRADGRSAVAAAAYRAGETLPNEAEEKDSNFGGRRDVIHAEIILPAGAPVGYADRATLWNAVEAGEKRKDARLAKEIEFSLPRELPRDAWIDVMRAFAARYTAAGHIVDAAIHDDGTAHNPHVHMMLTTRGVDAAGFGKKMREADSLAFVKLARARWEAIANAALGKAGSEVGIDSRSHAARGLDNDAGRHRGPDPEERRARRAQRSDDMAKPSWDKAHRQIAREAEREDRYPALRARPDWPNMGNVPKPGMDVQAQTELAAFWREVDKRQQELRAHGPTPSEQRSDPPAPVQTKPPPPRNTRFVNVLVKGREDSERINEQVLSQRLAEARAEIARLKTERDQARAESDAFRAQWPTHSWSEQERIERDRADAFPVPGPDGRPISAAQQDNAERAMFAEMTQPARASQPTPRPETFPPHDRDAAQAASMADMERDIPVPPRRDRPSPQLEALRDDPDLAWLAETPARAGSAPAAGHDPDLDWLRLNEGRQPSREQERERDPDR